MHKLFRGIAAGLLAAGTMVGTGGSAQAATVPGTAHRHCQIPHSNFLFTYDLHYTYAPNKVKINYVKVTDAAAKHWMASVDWRIEDDIFVEETVPTTWIKGETKYPVVQIPGPYGPYWTVTIILGAYNNAGGLTPLCRDTVTIYG